VSGPATITVVTPTLGRPDEVRDLLANLAAQTAPPAELVLVDGAPPGDERTREVVAAAGLPFAIVYVRRGGGTAIQRNAGIDVAGGELIAFVDDDIRLEPDYFARTPVDDVRALEAERRDLQEELTDLMTEWEELESEIGKLER